jgi:hypothetical protein
MTSTPDDDAFDVTAASLKKMMMAKPSVIDIAESSDDDTATPDDTFTATSLKKIDNVFDLAEASLKKMLAKSSVIDTAESSDDDTTPKTGPFGSAWDDTSDAEDDTPLVEIAYKPAKQRKRDNAPKSVKRTRSVSPEKPPVKKRPKKVYPTLVADVKVFIFPLYFSCSFFLIFFDGISLFFRAVQPVMQTWHKDTFLLRTDLEDTQLLETKFV